MTNEELTQVLQVGSTVRCQDGKLCLVEALLVEGDDKHALRLKELATHTVFECGAGHVTAVVTHEGEAQPEVVARHLESQETEESKECDGP